MSRADHKFQFRAVQISAAAAGEASYHEERAAYWQGEYEQAVETVEDTIGAKIVRQPMTGGFSVDVVVDYGDRAAYSRMQEAFRKMISHREQAESLRSDEALYLTQGERTYELTVQDVQHYRLGMPLRQESQNLEELVEA